VALARRGLQVFPVDDPAVPRCLGIRTDEHDPATCTERGKHPVVKFTQHSTTDEERIRKLFLGLPRNVGVFCGPRLLVVDEDAADAFAAYAAEVGQHIPPTYTVRTGKGRHYYFAVPAGQTFSNAEGALHGRGVNVRSGNAYVVAAGSQHASGVVYETETDAPIAPMPDWLVDAVRGPGMARDAGTGTVEGEAPGWWRHGPIGPDLRHKSIASAAGHCRHLGMPIEDAVTICREVASRHDPAKYSDTQIVGKVRDFYGRYPAGATPAEVNQWLADIAGEGSPGDAELAPEPDRRAAALTRELIEQRTRREARRILDREDRPATRPVEALTLRERLARPRQPASFRVDGWQPINSRIVLAAQYKAGKTTITGNLARCMVDGGAWLGRYKVEPIASRFVNLDFEMSADQADDWLEAQAIVNDDRVVPIPLRGNAAAFDILDDGCRAEWAARLRQLDCGYLLLDCLRPVLDALGLDEHRDAGRFLVAFDALLADAEVGEAGVVHHMGHDGERARGDSRIRDWPDVEWRLVRQDDDPASPRFISAFGRDVDVPESQLAWDPVTRHLTLIGGTRRDAAATAALADVLTLLDDEPDLSGNQIEKKLADSGHTQKAIREAVKDGIRTGRIGVKTGSRNAKLHTHLVSSSDLVASSSTRSSEFVSSSIDDELNSDTDVTPPRCDGDTWIEDTL
jgi:hypothetical protein